MKKKARGNMEIYISHCEKCLLRLDVILPIVSSLYYKICLCSVEGAVIFNGNAPITERYLAMLEKRGFILTTERSNDSLLIKVLGHEVKELEGIEMHSFCRDKNKHV